MGEQQGALAVPGGRLPRSDLSPIAMGHMHLAGFPRGSYFCWRAVNQQGPSNRWMVSFVNSCAELGTASPAAQLLRGSPLLPTSL